MQNELEELLNENRRRVALRGAPFNPVTGLGSLGKRRPLTLPDFPLPLQYIPSTMSREPMVRELRRAGTLDEFIRRYLSHEPTPELREAVTRQWLQLRSRHDFPFWAATFVYIKNKDVSGQSQVLFRLTGAQRKFVAALEEARVAGRPIRLVLLKARQWGGSTTSQLYMAWLQLCHRKGLNSLIIAHKVAGSDEIKDMFDRMLAEYPLEMLYSLGEQYSPTEPKKEGVGRSGLIFRVPQRDCKVKIGTAESPDSCRGGDYALVHLSEVGLWKATDGKRPEDIVRSACGGVLYKPYTMIVYESTANGLGNFFHREYMDARDNPRAQFRALFVAWYEIEWNSIPFDSDTDRSDFAVRLLAGRHSTTEPSPREEPGAYLWRLWQMGATLEAINWYVTERSKHTSHGSMAAECPSDDVEAFVNSGAAVFDKYLVERLRASCRAPLHVGEIVTRSDTGEGAVADARFVADSQGLLHVWSLPDPPAPDADIITDRYLTVVDVGGRGSKADWSVIVVFDRLAMIDGGRPAVVAQWRGHTDIDLLAWKAAQIAAFYDESLLVIESNTMETRDRERHIDGGDQSLFILNQLSAVYPNLYARPGTPDDIRQGLPRKYGFHTNVATKPMIISSLIRAVREGLYTERDSRCLDEYLTYERKPNGAYGAIVGAHDDLLMTRAIGLHICFYEMDIPVIVTPSARRHSPCADDNITEAVF